MVPLTNSRIQNINSNIKAQKMLDVRTEFTDPMSPSCPDSLFDNQIIFPTECQKTMCTENGDVLNEGCYYQNEELDTYTNEAFMLKPRLGQVNLTRHKLLMTKSH
jgi:hypothetical protein